jgi:hypothetical protein
VAWPHGLRPREDRFTARARQKPATFGGKVDPILGDANNDFALFRRQAARKLQAVAGVVQELGNLLHWGRNVTFAREVPCGANLRLGGWGAGAYRPAWVSSTIWPSGS